VKKREINISVIRKRSPDFCYLGSVVAEDGGAKSDVNVRIQ
jgi:hypothetical protein